jgi:hypothetical protein
MLWARHQATLERLLDKIFTTAPIRLGDSSPSQFPLHWSCLEKFQGRSWCNRLFSPTEKQGSNADEFNLLRLCGKNGRRVWLSAHNESTSLRIEHLVAHRQGLDRDRNAVELRERKTIERFVRLFGHGPASSESRIPSFVK